VRTCSPTPGVGRHSCADHEARLHDPQGVGPVLCQVFLPSTAGRGQLGGAFGCQLGGAGSSVGRGDRSAHQAREEHPCAGGVAQQDDGAVPVLTLEQKLTQHQARLLRAVVRDDPRVGNQVRCSQQHH
jgi:hypothetical protein